MKAIWWAIGDWCSGTLHVKYWSDGRGAALSTPRHSGGNLVCYSAGAAMSSMTSSRTPQRQGFLGRQATYVIAAVVLRLS